MTLRRFTFRMCLAALLGFGSITAGAPITTAFSYQGRLSDNGQLANGSFDLRFVLYDASTNGTAVGTPSPSDVDDTAIAGGLFTATLDFGPAALNGDARWIEVAVRAGSVANSNRTDNTYTKLLPRQALTAAPYAAQLRGAFVDSSLRMGLGTTNPTHRLQVVPLSNATGQGIMVGREAAGSTQLTLGLGGLTNSFALIQAVRASGTLWGDIAMNTGGGNVGIGTAAPQSKLHIASNGGVLNLEGTDQVYVQYYPDGLAAGRKAYTGLAAASDINFTIANEYAGGHILLTPGASGGVGIGTSTPAQVLDVRGQVQVRDTLRLDAQDGPMVVRQWTPFTSGAKNGFGRWGMFMEPSTLFLGVPGTDYSAGTSRITLGGWQADSTRQDWMSLVEGGRVGIGTVNPAVRFHVVDSSWPTVRFESTDPTGTWLSLQNTSTGGGLWSLISSGSGNGEGAGNLLFHNTNTRVIFRGDGRVGINTTTPSSTLHVNGTTTTNALHILGGADIAEPFNVNSGQGPGAKGQGSGAGGQPNADQSVTPGMVVSIDPERAGELRVCTTAFDRTVAGVISGAGGISAGMTLQQSGTSADGKHPVALTGRVYCFVDADAAGAVRPGDMLTTSNTPGHAAKANDPARDQGAIIGKAMTALSHGKGLVLVLVNLQ